jgi:hypothetical protein
VNNFDSDIMDIVTMLRGADRLEPYLCAAAADEIEKLRKERDELRCEVCDWVGNHFKEPPQDVAKRNGWNCFDTGVWDCYKEETK